jgi:hypothetical protein
MAPTLPLPPPSPLFIRSAACLLGGVGFATGIQSLLSPLSYARTFGLPAYASFPDPPSKTPGPVDNLYDAPTPNPFAITTGIRNLAFGLSQYVFAYRGDWEALGLMWAVGVVVAMGDAWVIRKFIGKEGGKGKESQEDRGKWVGHAVGGAVIGGLGAWVLGVGVE